jgi:hypothetical protein
MIGDDQNLMEDDGSSRGLGKAKQKWIRDKFSPEEDELLLRFAAANETPDWASISKQMPRRNARQCRERYIYYLSPGINTAKWTDEEDELLLAKYEEIGRKWVLMAEFFQNRTDTMLKNRFNVLLRRARRFHERQKVKEETALGEESVREKPLPLPGIESFECPFLFPLDLMSAVEVPVGPIRFPRITNWT